MDARLALTMVFLVAGGCGGRPVPGGSEAGTDDGGSGSCPAVHCGAAQACRGGECIPRSRCEAPLDLCTDAWGGQSCVDLLTDPLNCGVCGDRCPHVCSLGFCVTPPECPPSRTVCEGACVDLESDPLHCGACGRHCALATPYCTRGACGGACPGDLDVCDGTCVDLLTDVFNCGGCGIECIESCAQGMCW
jgi:hypothetical protein